MGTGEEQDFSGDIVTTTFAYNVHADSDFLIAFFMCYHDPGAFAVATYDGVNLIEEDTPIYANPVRIGCWYLTNPATGNNNFVFTWANNERPWITIADFQGVHQGNPIYTSARNTGNGKVQGGPINTLPLGYTVEAIAKGHTDWDVFSPTGGQAVHQDAATSTTGIFSARLASLDPGGLSSVNLTWSTSVVRVWHQLAKSLRNRVPLNRLLMVG